MVMAFRAAATVLQRRFSVGAAFFDGRCNRCSSRVTTLSRQALTPFFSGPDDKRKTKQKKKHITNRCRPGQSRRNGGTRRHPASKDGVGRSKESEQRVINTKLSEPGPHLFWPDADTRATTAIPPTGGSRPKCRRFRRTRSRNRYLRGGRICFE